MTADHINKYLFNGNISVLYDVGRIALPMFVFVLSYNLARKGALERGTYKRAKKHLLGFAVISSIPYILMSGYTIKVLPLNILFTLLLITVVVENIDKGKKTSFICSIAIFIVFGYFVEYWWPAIAMGVAAWAYCRFDKTAYMVLTLIFCTSLYLINGNLWSLAAVPIVFIFSVVNVNIPRIRWVFYAYYPLHLFVIYLVRIPLQKAGYIFI